MNEKNRKIIIRWVIYFVGLAILSLGLTLNTLSGLGASAIISVSYTISLATGLDFSNMTMVFYGVLIVLQLIIRGKNRRWLDLLQFLITFVMTSCMSFFASVIGYQSGNIVTDLLVLAAAICCVGVGADLTILPQLIPNPGDGIVAAISDVSGKDLGFCKNCVDFSCAGISLIIGSLVGKPLLGIGLGTVIASIFTGRVMHLMNKFVKDKIENICGLAAAGENE